MCVCVRTLFFFISSFNTLKFKQTPGTLPEERTTEVSDWWVAFLAVSEILTLPYGPSEAVGIRGTAEVAPHAAREESAQTHPGGSQMVTDSLSRPFCCKKKKPTGRHQRENGEKRLFNALRF